MTYEETQNKVSEIITAYNSLEFYLAISFIGILIIILFTYLFLNRDIQYLKKDVKELKEIRK